VPLIVRWPGMIPAGMVSDVLGVNFDLLPTFLAAAGIPLPTDRILDGRDLFSTWGGAPQEIHERFFYYDGPNLVAVQQEGWKYHRRNMSDNGGYPAFFQGPFLFDLRQDPTESYSLIETYPQKAQEMAAILDEFEAEMEVNVRGWVD
jgi:arylsulfatase A-like enzyme